MSDSDMPLGGDMGGLFTEQMIDALRRKDYFARLDRVLTSIDGKYSDVERLTKELADSKAEVKRLTNERIHIFWIMYQASMRKIPCQYRERRWKEDSKWVDCADGGPVWNWTDCEYRIKDQQP